MSTTIDEKVVEMRFDNNNFEKNVQTSLNTLSDLKQSLKMDGATKGLENVEETAREVSFEKLLSGVESLQNRFSAFGIVGMRVLENITDSMMNLTEKTISFLSNSIVQGGINRAMNIENAHFMLQGLLKDEEKVKEIMNQAAESVDGTAYSYDSAAKAASQFAASGVETGQQLKTALRAITGVAAMTNSEYESISQIFTTVAGNGRLMGDQLLQLSTRGLNAASTIAEYITKVGDGTKYTEADIREMVTKGKISFDIFATAMDNAFGEHAKKANETFSGSISNIKAALARIGAGFVSPLIEQNGALVTLFNTVRERINDVKKSLVFDKAIGNVNALSKQFTDFVEKVANSTSKYLSKLNLKKHFEAFYNIIEALKNILKGFASIVKPIFQAFQDIFPPVTIDRIVLFSESIKELTSRFRLNEKDSKNLKSTFKGLFAVIDIGIQAVKAILSAILPVTPALGDVGSGILGVTGKIGEWITSLDDAIKKNDIFSNTIQEIKDVIGKFAEFIAPAFEAVKSAIKSGINSIKEFAETHFVAPDTSGLDKFTDKIKERFNPVTVLFEGIKKAFAGLWEFFKKLSPLFATLATLIGQALSGIADTVSKAFDKSGFNGITDLLNGGMLVGIGLGISKFIEHIQTVINKAGGMFSGVNRILFQLKNTLITFQAQIKANILMKIASAVAILTASLIALSLIDSDRLNNGLSAITGLFADLFVSMAAFEKIMSGSAFMTIGRVGTAMLKMSAAVLVLSLAMKKLSDVDQESLNNALVAVTMLIGDLTASAITLSKWGSKIQTSATGMILFSEAINILADAVKKLGQLDFEVLEKGLVSVGIVMGELSAFMIGAKFGSFKASQGLAIIELAAALLILQKAVSAFGSMDAMGMIQGLGGVGAVLAEIAGFMKLTGDSKKMISTATGVTILGAAMLIFSNAVKGFAELSWEEFAKGLLGMGVSLAAVAVAMNNMPVTTPIIASGLVLVGAALKIIASSVKDFGSMSWEGVAKSLIVLAGSLVIIAGALKLMKRSLSGAAALLVVAGALAILTPTLKAFGKMSLAEIGKSLLALAGAFTVIGVAGLLLEPVVPAILGLSAAVALLGVGTLACGAGLLAFSAGLATLSVSGTAAIATLVLAIEAIISLIPQISIKVAEGITAFIVALGESVPQIMDAIFKIISSTLQMIRDTVPDLVETVLFLVQELLISLDAHLPTILEHVMSILITVLEAIRDNIGDIVTIVVDVILKTLEAIANKLPDIVQTGIDIVVNLIDGLAKGIEDNAPRIRDAFIHLFQSLIKAVLTFLGIHSPSPVFLDIGINVIKGLINGIGQMLGNLLSKIGEVLSSMVTAIKNKLGEFLQKGKEVVTNIKDGIANKISEVKSKVTGVVTTCVSAIKEKVSEFKKKGQELMTNLKTGISDKLSAVKDAAKNIISNALTAIKDKISEWTDVGKNLIEGLNNGIASGAGNLVNGAKDLAGNVVKGWEKILGINSPSKVFAEIGLYCDQGLVKGFERGAKDISKASEEIGNYAIAGISKSMNRISDVIDLDIDADPTIKPVLDLTDVSNGIKNMDKMLYTQKSIDLAGNVNISMNSSLEKNQNEKAKVYNDSGVIKEIGKLREDIGNLAGAIAQMRLVMDTGTLVGALSGPMDSVLGMRTKYGQRGN